MMNPIKNRIAHDRHDPLRFGHWIVALTGLWLFLLPFGKGEYAPACALSALGFYKLLKTRGECAMTPAARSFLIILALHFGPVLISMTDAVAYQNPLIVLFAGVLSALAGMAIICAAADRIILKKMTVLLAAIVAFWFLDAGVQAVFGRDFFGMTWEKPRLSGPWTHKTQMGDYSGAFSAMLLIYAIQNKWKPAFLAALFAFLSVIVLLNNTRGGWVMYGMVVAVAGLCAVTAPLKKKLLACTALLLTGIFLTSGLYLASDTFKKRVDQTLLIQKGSRTDINKALSNRLSVWAAAIGIIKDHPVNGVGANNYRELCTQYWPKNVKKRIVWAPHPHQFILEYATGTGLIGVLGFFTAIGFCLRWWITAPAEYRRAAAGYGLTLAVLYFPLNINKSAYSSEFSLTLWMLISLYIAAIRPASAPEHGLTGKG